MPQAQSLLLPYLTEATTKASNLCCFLYLYFSSWEPPPGRSKNLSWAFFSQTNSKGDTEGRQLKLSVIRTLLYS